MDDNQTGIVAALRKVGAFVQHLHQVGEGCPDLLVSFRRQAFLLEVKSPDGSLTPDQVRWHYAWRGPPVAVVHSPQEALQAIGALPVKE